MVDKAGTQNQRFGRRVAGKKPRVFIKGKSNKNFNQKKHKGIEKQKEGGTKKSSMPQAKLDRTTGLRRHIRTDTLTLGN